MILTVTANPALDVTYLVDELRVGSEHRVRTVHLRPGGKGVNVARVLVQLGEPCTATGLAGGATGSLLRAELARGGVPEAFLPTDAETRRTVVVAGGGATTSLWEPGPELPAGDGERLVASVAAALPAHRAVVISGSTPPGLPRDLPARLAATALAAGVPALVDADGPALAAAARVPGVVVKPNAAELGRLVGRPVPDAAAALTAVADLRRGSDADWVVTLGGRGLVACTNQGSWVATPPDAVRGTPTGAGDATAAGLARALAAAGSRAAVDWPAALADAVALGAAAVLCPVAGEVDLPAYASWRGAVRVDAVPAPQALHGEDVR